MNNYIFNIRTKQKNTSKNFVTYPFEVQAQTIEEANAKCVAYQQELKAKNANIIGSSFHLSKAHALTGNMPDNKPKSAPSGFSSDEMDLIQNL